MANVVYAIATETRSHRLPLFSRVRSMWQVFIDNLDVLEVCDWSDVQELSESGHHEDIIIAREGYEHFQVPRSPGKEVVRVLHTKALGDHVDGFQGVIGPPATLVRELIHFTLVTLFLIRVGRKWMQILAVQARRYELFQRNVDISVFLLWLPSCSFCGATGAVVSACAVAFVSSRPPCTC